MCFRCAGHWGKRLSSNQFHFTMCYLFYFTFRVYACCAMFLKKCSPIREVWLANQMILTILTANESSREIVSWGVTGGAMCSPGRRSAILKKAVCSILFLLHRRLCRYVNWSDICMFVLYCRYICTNILSERERSNWLLIAVQKMNKGLLLNLRYDVIHYCSRLDVTNQRAVFEECLYYYHNIIMNITGGSAVVLIVVLIWGLRRSVAPVLTVLLTWFLEVTSKPTVW